MSKLTDAQVRKLIELLVDWRAVGTSLAVSRDEPTSADLEQLCHVLAYTEGMFSRLELLKILDEHWFKGRDRLQ